MDSDSNDGVLRIPVGIESTDHQRRGIINTPDHPSDKRGDWGHLVQHPPTLEEGVQAAYHREVDVWNVDAISITLHASRSRIRLFPSVEISRISEVSTKPVRYLCDGQESERWGDLIMGMKSNLEHQLNERFNELMTEEVDHGS